MNKIKFFRKNNLHYNCIYLVMTVFFRYDNIKNINNITIL